MQDYLTFWCGVMFCHSFPHCCKQKLCASAEKDETLFNTGINVMEIKLADT